MPHNTQNLRVYALARELTISVHVLGDTYRKRLMASSPTLRNQMLRAADAILFNLAEGAGKSSDRSFVQFIDIAVGSCNELEAQLDVAIAVRALPESSQVVISQTVEVRKMLLGLRQYLRQRAAETQFQIDPQLPPDSTTASLPTSQPPQISDPDLRSPDS